MNMWDINHILPGWTTVASIPHMNMWDINLLPRPMLALLRGRIGDQT
jgi:hypothetical protein